MREPQKVERFRLGGHLKTGHMWSPQNRPTERTQNKSSYTLSAAIPANFSANESGVSLILTAPGRKTRQRRDATGAPTQGPEWRGGAGRPDRAILAESDKSQEREGSALALKKGSFLTM